MLTFHPLTLDDKPKIDALTAAEDSRSADFNFGNLFLWNDVYREKLAAHEQRLIALCGACEPPAFPFPIGSGPLAPVLAAIEEYAAANGFPLTLLGLEARHIQALEQLWPGRFTFTEERRNADYLYEIERLVSLPGKQLHGKRNHCNRFAAEHDWSFELLRPAHFPACMALLTRWTETAGGDAADIAGEHAAILRALDHYDALALLGGALFAEGELVAFTVGEQISSDTFDVHFEKARADVSGAYSMVNREFAQLVHERLPSICYVNREDDMGLENLRKSKESYGPDLLLRKYTARENTPE